VLRLSEVVPLMFQKQSIDLNRALKIAFTHEDKASLKYTVKVGGEFQAVNLTADKGLQWRTHYLQIAKESTALAPLTISVVSAGNSYLASVGLASKGNAKKL
jgi:hypothetical protein